MMALDITSIGLWAKQNKDMLGFVCGWLLCTAFLWAFHAYLRKKSPEAVDYIVCAAAYLLVTLWR